MAGSSILESRSASPSSSDVEKAGLQTDDKVTPYSRTGQQGEDYHSIHTASDDQAIGAGVGQTARRLSSVHITMIGIGGGIGIGLFLGAGAALAKAGPVGILLAYILVGALLWTVMISLGEMSTRFPGSGSFTHFAARFLDPAIGMTLGWNYFYCYAIGIASELVAVSTVIGYWNDTISVAVWIAIFLVACVGLNVVGVRAFGTSEVITSLVKIFAFVGLIILGIVIDLGGAPTKDRLGFRYWKDPGPFQQFNGIPGSTGRFLAFFSSLINAGFTYIGTETVVLASGEASNPTRQIPMATRRTLGRIGFFYIAGVTVMGLTVPANDPNLLNGTGNAFSSPFVIAIERAHIGVLPHIINAVIMISAFSAGSSYIFVSSRTLYSLALQRQAPRFLTYVNSQGTPIASVLASSCFGLLAFLSVSNGSAKAFTWLSTLSTQAGFFAWATICWAFIRFQWACKVQGIDRKAFNYTAPFMPYAAWFGLIVTGVIILFSGFAVFLSDSWNTQTFISNYIGIPIYFVPWIVWKFWHKTKWVSLEKMDLQRGRLSAEEIAVHYEIEERQKERDLASKSGFRLKVQKVLNVLF